MKKPATNKKRLEEQSAFWDSACIDEREWVEVTDLVEVPVPLHRGAYEVLQQLAGRKKKSVEQTAAELLENALR